MTTITDQTSTFTYDCNPSTWNPRIPPPSCPAFFASIPIEEFTQSQSHGLFWDSEIREKVFELPNCKNDTTKFDIPCNKNKWNPTENISIKTSGNENIDCGDVLRFYDRDTNDITIILVKYAQTANEKQIRQIMEINYNDKLKHLLFGTIPRCVLSEYVAFIKSIPHGKVTTETKQKYMKMKKDMQKQYNMKINISPKVDSKNQRRVQCSIPKTDVLFREYPEFILSTNETGEVRNIPITRVIRSTKRVRSSRNVLLVNNQIIEDHPPNYPMSTSLNLRISSCVEIDLGPTVLLKS